MKKIYPVVFSAMLSGFAPSLLQAAESVWISALADGSVAGLNVADDDIVAYDIDSGQWSVIFDGSQHGVNGDINALTVDNDGAVIFSLAQPQSLTGVGAVDDSDLVRFIPNASGDYSAGVIELLFDGSDVGLTTSAEDITAVSLNTDGTLFISVRGNFSADGVTASSQDILKFDPLSLGATTAGTWSVYLDGSSVMLTTSTENIWGISHADEGIALTTLNAFSVSGAAGNGRELFVCDPILPAPVGCVFSNYPDFAAADVSKLVNALHINLGDIAPPEPTAPVAVDDEFSTGADESISVGAESGVLSNDTSLDPGPVNVELVADASSGELSLQADGSFNYEPAPAFTGLDSFSYRVANSVGFSNTATVEISVIEPGNNDAISNKVLVSALANGVVEGISFTDDDILSYDTTTGVWAIFFDGSLFGLTKDINAITIDADGSLIFSLAAPQTIAGVGVVDDSDLVRFIPATPGDYTNGTLELLFDGSDVGLTSAAEDITGVSVRSDGGFLLSVRGNLYATGVTAKDEDIVLFTPAQLGTNTAGLWSMYFDGSENSLSTSAENIWGISESPESLFLSTLGNFAVPEVNGSSRDVLRCDYSGAMPIACSFDLLEGFPGSSMSKNINALHVDSAAGVPAPRIPVAVEDTYSLVENSELSVDTAIGLLSNDIDVTSDTTVREVTGVSSGELNVAPDGSFTYSPMVDFVGTDSFTYRATNSNGSSDPIAVNLLVESDTSDPANSLVTVLDFNEGSGNPGDSSDAGNDGVLSGAQYSTDTADGSAYSLLFDGVDDLVELGSLPDVTQGLTLAAWVKASSFPGSAKDGRIISRANGLSANSHYYMLSTIAAGNSAQLRFRVKVNGVTETLIVSGNSNALSAGVWYHVAGTFDGATMRIYINGAEVASRSEAGTLTSAIGIDTAIGGQPGGGRHWHGLIDEVQILNTALDAAGILALFNSGAAVIARDNTYSTAVDSALTVAAPGVLGDDDDTDGSGLTASLLDDPLFGNVTLQPDGAFSYTPDASFVGTDTFRYRAVRADGEESTATVTIRVLASSDAVLAFSTGEIAFDKFVVDNTVDNAHYVGAADYNNDGLVDLIGTDYVDDTIFLYDQQVDGSFVRRVLDASLDGAYPAHIGDIDKDGDEDILGGGYLGDTVALYLNDGAGQFSRQVIDASAAGIHSMEIVDLDDDGDNDIVSALQDAGDIVWYENTGNLTFTRRNIDLSMPKAKRATFADFDNDGDTDVVAAADGVNRIAWYENDGSQNFTRRVIDNNLEAAYFVHTDDMDGDGYADIVAAGKLDNQIVLYRNKTDGTFQKVVLDTLARGARSTFAADIDADGRLDAIGNGLQADTIAWYRNNGNGSYTRNVVDSNADGAYGVLAHDVDSDGDQDLLLASRDDFTITVYYNTRVHEWSVAANGSLTITSSMLEAVGLFGNPPADVVYTVATAPGGGDLLLNGLSLNSGDTFTQADVNSSSLIYTRTNGNSDTDSAELSVTIPGSGGTPLQTRLVFTP